MELRGYLVGSFPRPAGLIKLLRDYSKGKTSFERLEHEFETTVNRLVRLQAENGLTYVVDGMLLWDDLFRPLSTALDGLEVDGLSRWFDNNVFFKKLVVKNRLTFRQSLDAKFFNPDGVHAFKLILPDPYTAAVLSEDRWYNSLEKQAYDWAACLAQTASSLEKVEQLQLTAPSLVFEKIPRDHLEIAKECVRMVKEKVRCELMLHMPFGNLSNILPEILDFPADVIGVDVFKTRLNSLAEYSLDKRLYLGVLDGRNTLMEDVETTVRILEGFFSKTGLKQADVGPSCELEFLPFESSEDKVKRLGEVLRRAAERL
ncbi:MAG: hypothetical protein RMK31_07130 [Candidatus Caldarchaeum sp.]|nr:hypothetical protein [Candidatus Caldarchaeum sp.]